MLLLGRPQPATMEGEALPPVEEGWQTRSDLPADINPTGTLWQIEKNWTFDGTEGAAPPAPWHTGIEWAGAHETLGGHIWRDQVNLDSMAYLDGTGSLVLKLDWDATNSTAVGAYLITDQDGSTVRPDDYRLNPVGEDGVWLEFTATFPETQPSASWGALWTYATADDTALVDGQPTNNEEIDLCEKIGNSRPYYQERFHTNTHGRRTTLESDCAADEGLAAGEGFAPEDWGGLPPNDGQPHVWGMMWSPGEDGTQEFYYDGYKYASRPKSTDTIHSKLHGLRISWETDYPGPFGAGAADPSTETAYFPKEIKIATVRVIRRRLPPPPPSGDKPNVIYGPQGLGLSSIYQDQYHIADPSDLAYNLWNFSPGSYNGRIGNPTVPHSNTVRMATVTLGDKPARRVNEWRMPQTAWFGWKNSVDVVGSSKGSVTVDMFIPSDYKYKGIGSDGRTDGKTAIALYTGPDGDNGGHIGAEGGNTYPWQQGDTGGVNAHHGLNFKHKDSNENGEFIELGLYSHAIGYGGLASKRSQIPSTGAGGLIHPAIGWTGFLVPRNRWFTIEMFCQVDTNGQNGILSVWVTDNGITTRVIHLTDLDFGGMTGTRNYATMGRQDNFTWGTTPQSLVLTKPAKFRGIMSRHMPGGWPGVDDQASRNKFWNRYSTGRWHTYNWRIWQG